MKAMRGGCLQTALDQARDASICHDHLPNPAKRDLVHFASDKAPTILTCTEQRIDAVRSGADVQHTDGRSTTKVNEIRQMMQVITAPRDRRAEIALGDIPMRQSIGLAQQRLIQRLHRQWVRIIDGVIAIGIRLYKALQRRTDGDEGRKIVTLAKTIPRMHAYLGGLILHRRPPPGGGRPSPKYFSLR